MSSILFADGTQQITISGRERAHLGNLVMGFPLGLIDLAYDDRVLRMCRNQGLQHPPHSPNGSAPGPPAGWSDSDHSGTPPAATSAP